MKKNFLSWLVLVLLLLVGLFYRLYNLQVNQAFWSDETTVAVFTRAIIDRGLPMLENGYFTNDQQGQYWLSAGFATIWGLNEFAVRFPSVLFGVLTVGAVYFLGRELLGKNVALVAAIFITFLNIEILWSRQARPYQALQFFFLLAAYYIWKLTAKDKFAWRYLVGFLFSGIAAVLMHGLGVLVFLNGFACLLFSRPRWFKKSWLPLLALLPLIIFGFVFKNAILPFFFSPFSTIGQVNNLYYYRVFLWHNHALLIFLSAVGLLALMVKRKREWQLLAVFLVTQGLVASFLLGQPFTRYYYPVFPFLILLSAAGLEHIGYSLSSLSKNIGKISALPISLLLTFLVVVMGDKFTVLPQKVYSLNEDMQETPEVDWKKVYSVVKQRLLLYPGAVVVANWNDLPVWYLGEGKVGYLTRVGEKSPDTFSGALILGSLEEFKETINRHPQGIYVIDSWDNRVPTGVRELARKNLKKEYEIDRLYPVQPRYWPVEVYSWGM